MKIDKLNYIQHHILTIEERMETVKEVLKWVSPDIKVIKRLSKQKEEKAEKP